MYLKKIVDIANTCILLEVWSKHFKEATSVVIPKSNKNLYNIPKLFYPIVLLNMMGKLIKKIISNCLQFHMSTNSFLDLNQLGGIRQHSTINTDIHLTHVICTDWAKQYHTSVIAFNVV